MKTEFNIIKIVNFPIEQNRTIEVFQNFTISAKTESGRVPYTELNPNEVKRLLPDCISKGYRCKALYCEDDEGVKITLFKASIIVYYNTDIDYEFDYGFNITQNGFIVGAHISSLDKVRINDLSVCFDKTKQFKRLALCNGVCFRIENGTEINISAEFCDDGEVVKPSSVTFTATNDRYITLNNMKDTFFYWREIAFLLFGFFPSFSMYAFSFNRNLLYHCDYSRRFADSSIFCLKRRLFRKYKFIPVASIDWKNVFTNWMKLREETGRTLDIYFSAIHVKDIFWEFHPFQIYACIEGFVKKKHECFNVKQNVCSGKHLDALISYSDETERVFNDYLKTEGRESLIKRVVNHRNWLAHANPTDGFMEQGKDSDVAVILLVLLKLAALQIIGVKFNKRFFVYE